MTPTQSKTVTAAATATTSDVSARPTWFIRRGQTVDQEPAKRDVREHTDPEKTVATGNILMEVSRANLKATRRSGTKSAMTSLIEGGVP